MKVKTRKAIIFDNSLKLLVGFFSVFFIPHHHRAHAEKQNKVSNSTALLVDIPCLNPLFKVLEKFETPTKWESVETGSKAIKKIASVTDKMTVKFEINIRNSKTVEFKRKTSTEITIYRFTSDKCDPEINIESLKNFSSQFGNSELDIVLSNSRKQKWSGVIYVWSPNMELSKKGLIEGFEIAQKNRFEFIGILDPNADEKSAAEFLKKNKLPKNFSKKMTADQLFSKKLHLHFPTALLIRSGKLLTPMRPGYDRPEKFLKYLKSAAQPVK